MSKSADETRTPMAAAPDTGESRRTFPFFSGKWPLAFLLLLALLPYSGILRNDFAYIYDDKAQIIDNPYVHSFGHLREVLTTPVWSFAAAHGMSNYYRPVMTFGFLLCYQLFGPVAWGFHLASLLLHAGVVVVLYLFATRLLKNRGAAFAAAALFAIHPIHVESVAWISAVTDLEVTFFYLLTFWCFLQLDKPGGHRLGLQILMGACFLLALLSKEQALTLAVLAVIYEHFYRGDRATTTLGEKIGRYGALWLLLIAYLIMRVHTMGSLAHPMGWVRLTPVETLLSAFALFGQYIFMLLWPAHLSAFYAFHASSQFYSALVLEGVVALILCVLAFSVLWRKARPASFGILWLLCTLGPVLNARWMGTYVLAERYAYLPSVGFCLAVGWGIAALWQNAAASKQRGWTQAVVAGAGIVAVLCVLRAATRIPDWQDDITLISHALAAEPDEFILHDALGDAYWLRGAWPQAEVEWKESLRLHPDYFRPINALGALCAKQGRYSEAEAYLQRAIVLDPNDPDSHLNLGAVYAETGKMEPAEEQFRAAITIAPLNFPSHNVLGKVYFDSGRLKEAEEQFRQSLEIEPNIAAYDYLGYIYQQSGDGNQAETAFKSALTMNGNDSHAHYHLGLLYAASGRNAQAIEEMQAALAADPNNAEIQTALGKLRRQN